MPYNFRSVGGSITDRLIEVAARREAEARAIAQQEFENNLALRRESRLDESGRESREITRENIKLSQAQREAAAAASRQATAASEELQRGRQIERAGKTFSIGDDVTEVEIPDELKVAQKSLGGSFRQGGMQAPVTAVTSNMLSGAPAVPAITPGVISRSQSAITQAPTGRQTFRGTTEQRSLEGVLNDPSVDPRIKQLLRVKDAGGDISGMAGMLKPDEPTKPAVGSLADYLTTRYGPRPTQAQIEEGSRLHAKLNDQPPQPFVVNIPGYGPGLGTRGGTYTPFKDPQGNPVSGFSGAGAGAEGWQNVVARATDNLPGPRRAQKLATFSRLFDEGQTQELADQVRQTVIDGETVDLKNQVIGRQTMRASLLNAKQTLEDMKQAGIPTNWFVGTAEDLLRKVGATQNPQYVSMANQLADSLITYRRQATGVSFGEREAADYARMFPNYRNTIPVNDAQIAGLLNSINSNDAVYWSHKLGPEGARLVLGTAAESNSDPQQAARDFLQRRKSTR